MAWDVHAHLIPASVIEAARQGEFGMSLRDGYLLRGGIRAPLHRIADTASLMQALDSAGLTGAIVSVPPFLLRYDLGLADAKVWTQLVNNGLAEMVSQAPERLRALAYLPCQHPALAAEEAGRWRGGAWAGVTVGSSIGSLTLDHPSLADVWEEVNRAERFVFIHPVEAPDDRLHPYYLHNLLGNPYETALAAACLLFSGMVSRYDRTRFCLAHAGGASPFLIGRWQRGYETKRPGISALDLSPQEAFQRLWFDSITHSRAALELLIKVVGSERVLLGTDYPFPMGEADPLATLAFLPPADLQAIRDLNVVQCAETML